ncbi:MAG: tetratricopeptide repeat protein [Chloroflexi bacterium]|nr:tetratricopeptide repeat protein [Chloroflexota bacterium]
MNRLAIPFLVMLAFIAPLIISCGSSEPDASPVPVNTQPSITSQPTAMQAESSGTDEEKADKHVQAGLELEGRLLIEEARVEYEEAIRLDPQNAEAYYGRGNANLQLGQLDLALQDFSKAILLDPNNAMAHANRAGVYLVTGKFDLAIEGYGEALRIDPQNIEYYSSRAMAYLNQGQLELAVQDLDTAINLAPDDSQAYISRAMVYTLLGRLEEAEQDINRSVELGFDSSVMQQVIENLRKQNE